MKNLIQKILIFVTIVGAFSIVVNNANVLAADGCEETSIIKVGDKCDDQGGGISEILQIVLDIMTVGVSVAAVLGIGISALTYATAGGNDEKVKKSKDRILQIVIGMLLYGAMWALLKWLIPGGIS